METTWWYIGAGTTIGGIQLVIGIAIGLWMRRSGKQASQTNDSDSKRAQEFAQELQALTSHVTRDVGRHQAQITEINGRLGAAKTQSGDSLTGLVVGVVGELMRSNQDLQAQLSSAEAELQRQTTEIETHLSKSMTDELTSLPNRRAFDDAIRSHLTNWRRHKVPFTLMLLDIDHFKHVNDEHGHVAGDLVLKTFAETVRSALRKPDFVARFGGEEFAVLLPYTTLDDSTIAGKKVLEAVESAVTRVEGVELRITSSAGVSSAIKGDNATEILKRADEALYASKRAGRNCGHTHDGRKCGDMPFRNIPHRADSTTSSQAGDAPNLTPEMETICSDLHDRAVELVNEFQATTREDAVPR